MKKIIEKIANFFKRSVKNRDLKFGASAVLLTLAVLAIIWFVSKILNEKPIRFDLTENKVYSLSDQTKKVIRELKVQVKATAFVRKLGNEAKYIEFMLTELGRHSDNFKFEIVDLDAEPVKWQEYMIGEPNTVVFEVGKRPTMSEAAKPKDDKASVYKRKDVKSSDIFQMDPYNYQKTEPKGEQAFINAVYSLTEDKQRVLYFTEGHRELSTSSADKNGLSELGKFLRNENYQIKTVKLAAENKVPADCDLLIVCGPAIPFYDKEAEVVKGYLAKGGKALIMVNPDTTSGLEKVMEHWNVKLEKGVILDRRAFFQPVIPIPSYKLHPITTPLDKDQIPVVMPFSRGMSDLKAKLDPRIIMRDDLLSTSDSSWAESNLVNGENPVFEEGKDVKGPLALAVAVSEFVKDEKADTTKPAEAEPKQTQFVVIGSSLFVTNTWVMQSKANLDFFMNSVNWMLKQENKISVRPVSDDLKRLEITPGRANLMFFVVVVIVPLGVIAAGIIVWMRRRAK